MTTKFDLVQTDVQYPIRYQRDATNFFANLTPGSTIDDDTCPERLASYSQKDEAILELRRRGEARVHIMDATTGGWIIEVVSWHIEENTYTDDGDADECIAVWECSPLPAERMCGIERYKFNGNGYEVVNDDID